MNYPQLTAALDALESFLVAVRAAVDVFVQEGIPDVPPDVDATQEERTLWSMRQFLAIYPLAVERMRLWASYPWPDAAVRAVTATAQQMLATAADILPDLG